MEDRRPTVASALGRHSALKRHRGPDDPATIAARRDLDVELAADHLRRVVEAAPPLTREQISRLAEQVAGPLVQGRTA